MITGRKPSMEILKDIPRHYFQSHVPSEFDPATVTWVTPYLGITAWDGVSTALDQGCFVINVADEIENDAHVKIPLEPGSGTVLMCLDEIQELIQDIIQDSTKQVVVHCAMGMERSVLSVVWYLHRNTGISINEAYGLVRESRPIALEHQDWIYS